MAGTGGVDDLVPNVREGPTGVVVGGVVVGGVGGGGGVPCWPMRPVAASTATPIANATVDRMEVKTMIRQGSLAQARYFFTSRVTVSASPSGRKA
jgi:hypothetical protein